MTAVYTLPLDTTDDSLELVGGKARSLVKMTTAGLMVPGGFLLTTSAYRDFVAANDLQDKIIDLARPELNNGAASFESASISIGSLFSGIELPAETTADIREAYAALDGDEPAVAVRSSANAEDLPGLSFAGQQETYLNVHGGDAVLAAVRDCWASLWTAQAISYRHQMGIEQDAVAMAVVVQLMVPSDVSGTLFTANPATGERSEMIVNASFGLGEAVVSGQVTADTYVVDRESLAAKETTLGAKEQKIVSDGDQGTRLEDTTESERAQSSLSEDALKELAQLALNVEKHFDGVPQDIEWAISDGRLWLLQARPITNLAPPPLKDVSWEPSEPGSILARHQVVEFMPGPLSPLFEELYFRAIDEGFALRRDWIDGTNEAFAKVAEAKRYSNETVNGYAYRYFGKPLPKGQTWPGPVPRERQLTVSAVSSPCHEWPHRWRHDRLPKYTATIEQWWRLDVTTATDEQLLDGICELTRADGHYWEAANGIIALPRWADQALQDFLQRHAPDAGFTSGMLLDASRSKTMQSQMDLWRIARQIQSDPLLNDLVIATPAHRLLDVLQAHAEGRQVVKAIRRYLGKYGHQVYSLDYAEPTPSQDPLPVLSALKTQVQDRDYDPVAQHAEVNAKRRNALREVTRHFSGKMRWRFRWRLFWAQQFYPNRDEGMFYVGAGWPVLQRIALELGRRLVDAGIFAQADDVYYLLSAELEQAIQARKENKALPELSQKTVERRELREARKRLNPPVSISPPPPADKTPPANEDASKKDEGTPSNVIQGTAVSPGKITAEVSVIHSPADFDQMKPNSILVCHFTTPAWTQLFSHAVGLVTDIGSITSHGSIVAREYGIPAVLGLADITKRLSSGQVITIDGDAGTVTIEEGAAAATDMAASGRGKPARPDETPSFIGLEAPFPFKYSRLQRIRGILARPFRAAFYRTIVAIVFKISGPRPML